MTDTIQKPNTFFIDDREIDIRAGETIFRAARSAFQKSHLEAHPVRLIGVGLSGLVHPEPDLQMTLFE